MIDKAYARADAPVQPQWLYGHRHDQALRIVDVIPARYDAGRWTSFGFNNGARANLHNFGNRHQVATRQEAEGLHTVAGLFHHSQGPRSAPPTFPGRCRWPGSTTHV